MALKLGEIKQTDELSTFFNLSAKTSGLNIETLTSGNVLNSYVLFPEIDL